MEKQKIECKFGYCDWIVKDEVYTCYISKKIIIEDAEYEFSGRHVDENTNLEVEAVNFRDCTISKVPQGLTQIFPNLKFIEIDNSKLKSVEQADLIEYKNFVGISFPSNKIHFLNGDLFTGWNNLEGIWIYSNKIEVIEPNILDGLDKLKIVDFGRNPFIDKCFAECSKIKNYGNSTLQEIKDEICRKFAISPWKKVFDAKKELQKEIAELKNKVEAADDKNNRLQQTISEMEIKVAIVQHKNEINEQKFAAHNNGICGDLKEFILDENFKDFTLQVDDEEFGVHKILLAARSPVLKEMIENNIDAEYLTLDDITKEIFREILNFMYTDELSQSDDINYLHLYGAAGRLKIESLKNFVAEKLIDKINIANALEILTLANKYDNENLRQKSFQIIKNELNDISIPITDDLAMQPDKLKRLLSIKKEKN